MNVSSNTRAKLRSTPVSSATGMSNTAENNMATAAASDSKTKGKSGRASKNVRNQSQARTQTQTQTTHNTGQVPLSPNASLSKHFNSGSPSERFIKRGSSLSDIIKKYEESSLLNTEKPKQSCEGSVSIEGGDSTPSNQQGVTTGRGGTGGEGGASSLSTIPSQGKSTYEISGVTPSSPPPSPPGMQPVFVRPGDANIASLTDAINSMHQMMFSMQSQLTMNIERKLSSLETQVVELHTKIDKQDVTFREMAQGMVSKSDMTRLESTLANVASQADTRFQEMDQELEQLRTIVKNSELERTRLHNRLSLVEEKFSLSEIKNKRYFLTLEGIAEVKDGDKDKDKDKAKVKDIDPKDLKTLVIDKFKQDADISIAPAEIVTIRRVGKIAKYRPTRPIHLTVRDDEARNKILSARGKLSMELAQTPIWINEDLPATYRRRKSMLRNLVKIAQEKKYKAKIDQGGISINGKLYLPDSFNKLPFGIRPQDASQKATVNGGIAFASEWSPLSNMFRTELLYHGILYHSAEQCYQHQKALFVEDEENAAIVLGLTDPYLKRLLVKLRSQRSGLVNVSKL